MSRIVINCLKQRHIVLYLVEVIRVLMMFFNKRESSPRQWFLTLFMRSFSNYLPNLSMIVSIEYLYTCGL